MDHFWEGVTGYFTFPEFYAHIAKILPPNPHCVEVGVYAGQSAACLGVELANKGGGRLDLVDAFGQVPLETVLANLQPLVTAGVLHDLHRCWSWDGAAKYADASLDFVFIDACHDTPAVLRDIDRWTAKVAPGGIVAGDDYGWESVRLAVAQRFPAANVTPSGCVWWTRK